MGDENGMRVALGSHWSDTPSPEDDNWALSFRPERAWIGIASRKEGGQKFVRGVLNVNKEQVKGP